MNMILLLHIGIAVLSLAFAAYVFIAPSKTKLKISYSLVGMTLGTGTYLVIMAPAHMAQACMAGLFYTGIVLVASNLAQRKLVNMASQADIR
jgi:hypothetical protein